VSTKVITKELSPNDAGETQSHQAGMLIPKDPRILGFFPLLDKAKHNPRCHLFFEDEGAGMWEFAFIYYNNALFGGTRNEYRLTRMTKYIKASGLVSGDEIEFNCDNNGNYKVSYRRQEQVNVSESGVLKLGSGWKIIQLS